MDPPVLGQKASSTSPAQYTEILLPASTVHTTTAHFSQDPYQNTKMKFTTLSLLPLVALTTVLADPAPTAAAVHKRQGERLRSPS